MTGSTAPADATAPRTFAAIQRYNAFLLLVAGLGGLLYGIDVGIIGGAYPYLAAPSGLTASQLSVIVAAVLLGMCGGLIGVVVPLYLAECLSASNRGKGTAIFQWLLTLGIVVAALIGIYFSYRVAAVTKLNDAKALLDFENHAWRSIFWVSLPPGLLFVLGAFFVTESPRWLFRRQRSEAAYNALLKSRSPEQASLEIDEMVATAHAAATVTGEKVRDSLLRRKYM